jgi:hypothetical protein
MLTYRQEKMLVAGRWPAYVLVFVGFVGYGCSGTWDTSENGAEPESETTGVAKQALHSGVTLPPGDGRSLDYQWCADFGGDCYLGNSGFIPPGSVGDAGKLMAYGTIRGGTYRFVYKYMPMSGSGLDSHNRGRLVSCTNGVFGSDPDPGHDSEKKCYYANYSRIAAYGETINPASIATQDARRSIAFGANGRFNFVRLGSGSVTCDTNGFGSLSGYEGPDSLACYEALNGYGTVTNEGGTFTVTNPDEYPMAYGAHGKFSYKLVSGSGTFTFGCNNDFFGGDPAPGQWKSCYKMIAGNSWLKNESQPFDYSQFCIVALWYTSGNGNVAGVYGSSNLGKTGTCGNNDAGGDPDNGFMKRCYGYYYTE